MSTPPSPLGAAAADVVDPSSWALDAVRDVAVAVAKQAGVLIRSRAGLTAVDHLKASSQDLVTVVDKACQDLIADAVARHFPTHAMLGEEDVPPGSAASATALAALADREWLWVVDPLDGTTNFVHGLPNSVVSIGVAHRGTVVVAVIYNPYLDELFTAVHGKGAFVNGQRMRVADTASLKAGLLAAGFHHTPHVASTMVRGVAAMLPAARGVRSFGSAALHLAYTAMGRLTGFWELDLSSWDIAAGALLVAEAGGRVTDTRGGAYTLAVRDVLATNGAPGVHDAVLAVLAGARADRPDPPAASSGNPEGLSSAAAGET